VNLTIPVAHADVSGEAIAAGKHVWSEKPLTLDVASGRALLAAADAAGVRVGCAPDTVLGAGLQTARRLIGQGAIGAPQTALTLMQSPGPESWHHSPEFLFQPGAGPLFDLGPYYFSALATIFGPAARVAAVGRRAAATRVIGSGPKAGTEFPVDVPTHVGALVEYESGAAASLLFSFDSPLPRHGFVEITGTEGTMAVPDPNRFDGDIKIHARGHGDWAGRAGPGPAPARGRAAAGVGGTGRARPRGDGGGAGVTGWRRVRADRFGFRQPAAAARGVGSVCPHALASRTRQPWASGWWGTPSWARPTPGPGPPWARRSMSRSGPG
jgi:predicted dehydrogenase